jgi:FKBP12-rapamycin complex-associated protein
VLGLGDRHPSNLMLDRTNGKIIHVDFGDCFETAMTREKFPEKIPFRLTRMLKNAMEVTGIEGTFRLTCEAVMRVLRTNRESVMAVLEAFVYDPLVYWKLFENNQHQQQRHNNLTPAVVNGAGEVVDERHMNSVSTINSENGSYQLSGGGGGDAAAVGAGVAVPGSAQMRDEHGEEQNHKALSVLKRVKDKLTGYDFGDRIVNEKEQVDLLIKQATSAENLCQCFIGWCAWW